MMPPLMPGHLHYRSARRKIALQDQKAAGGFYRLAEGMHDILAGRLHRGQCLGLKRPAGHGHRLLVDQVGLGEPLRDDRYSTGPVDVHRQATAENLPNLAPIPEPRPVVIAPTPAASEPATVAEVER